MGGSDVEKKDVNKKQKGKNCPAQEKKIKGG